MDGGRSPSDKVRQITLTDSLQRFMDFIWVNVALNYIENRNIATFLGASVD